MKDKALTAITNQLNSQANTSPKELRKRISTLSRDLGKIYRTSGRIRKEIKFMGAISCPAIER